MWYSWHSLGFTRTVRHKEVETFVIARILPATHPPPPTTHDHFIIFFIIMEHAFVCYTLLFFAAPLGSQTTRHTKQSRLPCVLTKRQRPARVAKVRVHAPGFPHHTVLRRRQPVLGLESAGCHQAAVVVETATLRGLMSRARDLEGRTGTLRCLRCAWGAWL